MLTKPELDQITSELILKHLAKGTDLVLNNLSLQTLDTTKYRHCPIHGINFNPESITDEP